MPKFAPPCAPRLTDFAKGSCGLEGEEDEARSGLEIVGNSGRDTFFSKKNQDIPENFRADLIPFGEFLYVFIG